MSHLPVQFPLPLPIDGHLGDFDDVPHLQSEGGLVVSVRHPTLLHAGVRGQRTLAEAIVSQKAQTKALTKDSALQVKNW